MACSEEFKNMLTHHDWVAIGALKEVNSIYSLPPPPFISHSFPNCSLIFVLQELIKTTNSKTSSNIKKSVRHAEQAGTVSHLILHSHPALFPASFHLASFLHLGVEIYEYHPGSPLIPGFEGYTHEYFQNEVMQLAKKWQGERKGWQIYSNQVHQKLE